MVSRPLATIISVRTMPGHSETARTSCGASSAAMSLAILSSPALDMPYSTECRCPRVPNDEMFAINPERRGTINRAASTDAT